MRKLKDVLRLRFELELSHRQIARSCDIGSGTVHDYLQRAEAAGVKWPLPEGWDEQRLETALFAASQPSSAPKAEEDRGKALPDFAKIHEQRQRHRHLTLQLLWEEYKQANTEGLGYSRFCELYQRWRGKLDVVLPRNTKRARRCSSIGRVRRFRFTIAKEMKRKPVTCLLGCSAPVPIKRWRCTTAYTYAEVTADEQMENWLGAHMRAFEFYGGVPKLLVPDNTKTGVNKACRYDPELNPTYQEMALHYGVGVVPARPYKPRDKA